MCFETMLCFICFIYTNFNNNRVGWCINNKVLKGMETEDLVKSLLGLAGLLGVALGRGGER